MMPPANHADPTKSPTTVFHLARERARSPRRHAPPPGSSLNAPIRQRDPRCPGSPDRSGRGFRLTIRRAGSTTSPALASRRRSSVVYERRRKIAGWRSASRRRQVSPSIERPRTRHRINVKGCRSARAAASSRNTFPPTAVTRSRCRRQHVADRVRIRNLREARNPFSTASGDRRLAGQLSSRRAAGELPGESAPPGARHRGGGPRRATDRWTAGP